MKFSERLGHQPVRTQLQIESIDDVKEGILLEAGYDKIVPNSPVIITSWAYEKAAAIKGIELIDNRAVDILGL